TPAPPPPTPAPEPPGRSRPRGTPRTRRRRCRTACPRRARERSRPASPAAPPGPSPDTTGPPSRPPVDALIRPPRPGTILPAGATPVAGRVARLVRSHGTDVLPARIRAQASRGPLARSRVPQRDRPGHPQPRPPGRLRPRHDPPGSRVRLLLRRGPRRRVRLPDDPQVPRPPYLSRRRDHPQPPRQ